MDYSIDDNGTNVSFPESKEVRIVINRLQSGEGWYITSRAKNWYGAYTSFFAKYGRMKGCTTIGI